MALTYSPCRQGGKSTKLGLAQIDKAMEFVELWRERLTSVSWFMRCINETIGK